MHRCPKNNFKV